MNTTPDKGPAQSDILSMVSSVLAHIPELLQTAINLSGCCFFRIQADDSFSLLEFLPRYGDDCLPEDTSELASLLTNASARHSVIIQNGVHQQLLYKFPPHPIPGLFLAAHCCELTPQKRKHIESILNFACLSLANLQTDKVSQNQLKTHHMFMASVNHEIRNQLNGLIGMADLLLSTTLDRIQQNYIHMLKNSAESISLLHSDMLDQSRMKLGQFSIRSQEFNLDHLLDEISIMHGYKAALKGLEIWTTYPPNIAKRFSGDPARIKQVITNLVSNALKYTNSGSISITVYASTDKKTAIRVSDTGTGMKASEIDSIFDSFTQVNPESLASIEGVGLGLAIAKQLVELMDGEICVSSTPGHGTDFVVTLPLTVAITQPEDDVLSALEDKTVLVCSKNISFARAQAENLTAYKLHTTPCTYNDNPCNLILQARNSNKPYDFIIADEPEQPQELSCLINSGSFLLELNNIQQTPKTENTLTKPIRTSLLAAKLDEILSKEESCFASPSNPELAAEKTTNIEHCFEKIKPCILVVDDDPVNRLVTTQMLEKLNCKTQQAASGVEALETLGTNEFNMILMDCYMPEMNGFETTKAIRTNKLTNAETPIIAFTAHTLEDRQWQQCGMNKCVHKPLRLKDLYKMILELMQPNGPIIDRQQACAMFGGDEKLLDEVIEIFINETPGTLKQLHEALEQENSQASILFSHRLKGSSRNIKAKEFEQTALSAEDFSRQNDLVKTKEILPAIEREFMRIFWAYQTQQVINAANQNQCSEIKAP